MDKPLKNDGPSTLSVLVGLAFTDADGPAFDQAAQIASRVPHGELHLAHVFDVAPAAKPGRELIEHLGLYVNEKAAMNGGLKALTVGIHLRAGKPVREILQLATELRSDLIVVGSHKAPHLKAWLMGSTAERLVADAPCPVLVAAPKAKIPPAQDPAIEPPCPDCLRSRAVSGGTEWWCERHAHHAKSAHTYSYQRELPFATLDSAIFPTGVAH